MGRRNLTLTTLLAILQTYSPYGNANENEASISITINVPVVCKVVNNEPICNLILTKVNEVTWIDTERGYKVYIINGVLIIEVLK